MGRPLSLRRALPAAALAFLIATPVLAADPAPVTRVYATMPGEPAYDQDPFGGNPFASAVIGALRQPAGDDLAAALRDATRQYSGGLQAADVAALPDHAQLIPQSGETAVALVAVFADYGDDAGLQSLPGAAFDAARVAGSLEQAGYATRMVIARGSAQYMEALAAFASQSAAADRALLYTTGHGSEAGGAVRLIPPDLDGPGLKSAAAEAIPLDRVAQALKARRSNWLLYGGCRDNPFEW